MQKFIETIKLICSSKRSVGIIAALLGLLLQFYPDLGMKLGLGDITSTQIQAFLNTVGEFVTAAGLILAGVGVADQPRTDAIKLNTPPSIHK